MFALGRLFAVVLHDPVIGYANNWDFIRLQSCVGLWPDYPDKPKESSHPDAPIQTYTYDGHRQPDLCLPSADLLFLKLALAGATPGSTIDIRVVGAMRAALLSALVILLFAAGRSGTDRLFVALAALLIFGDIAFASYFNTLYTEFSVIGGIFLLAASLCRLACSPPGSTSFAVLTVGFALLVFSKEQYAFLAAGLMLLAAGLIARLHKALPLASTCLALAGAGLFLQQTLWRQAALSGTIELANKTNTVLWAVLPNASDLPKALRILGLPESCAGAVGRSWYSGGVQENHPCPAVRKTNRLRLLPLFLSQPQTLAAPLAAAAAKSRPWRLEHLAVIERRRVRISPVYRWLGTTSPSAWVDRWPASAYAALLLASVLVSGASAWILAARLRSDADRRHAAETGSRPDLALAVLLGGAVACYALVSSVFGDGYHEVAKHAVGLGVGVMLQAAALAVLGGRLLAEKLTLAGGAGTA